MIFSCLLGSFSNLNHFLAIVSFLFAMLELLSCTTSARIGRVKGAFNCDLFIVCLVLVLLHLWFFVVYPVDLSEQGFRDLLVSPVAFSYA